MVGVRWGISQIGSFLVFGISIIVTVWAADLRIGQAWARPNPPVAPNGAVYMTVHNAGKQEDRLLGISGTIAERIELHESYLENGVMKMRRQDKGLAIPSGGTLVLGPGGLHVMLMGLKKPLRVGQLFTLSLHFEHAGEHSVEVIVSESAPVND